MSLFEDFHSDSTVQAPLDTAVLVLACATSVTVLALAALACVFCDRREGRSSISDSHRDTVRLDDLLSKPSLADPESVFSEAGSCEFLRPTRTGSWNQETGENTSSVRESVSLSGPADLIGYAPLNNTAGVPIEVSESAKWNVQDHKTGKAQRPSTNSKRMSELQAHHPQKTTDQCGHQGDGNVHDLGRNVQGSPKLYSQKDISGKVRLDSTALKIHRDSVTRESAPFLSSGRCSFSHEVGHIVHGNKVPRSSLSRTEEGDDGALIQPSSVTNNGQGTATMSLSFQTDQARNSCSEQVLIAGCHQTGRSGRSCSDDKISCSEKREFRDEHIDKSILKVTSTDTDRTPTNGSTSIAKTVSHGNTGSPVVCQLAPVSMRRCLSCMHGGDVCQDQLSRPRMKTFSLNLTIDFHFENNRDSRDDLPTIACSPLIGCDNHVDIAKCDKRVDTCDKYVTTSENKHQTVHNLTRANESSEKADTDAKERLLQKSFELKSLNLAKLAHKRRSEPTLPASRCFKECNLRHLSSFSEAESDTMTACESADNRSNPRIGHRPYTSLGLMTDADGIDDRVASNLTGIGDKSASILIGAGDRVTGDKSAGDLKRTSDSSAGNITRRDRNSKRKEPLICKINTHIPLPGAISPSKSTGQTVNTEHSNVRTDGNTDMKTDNKTDMKTDNSCTNTYSLLTNEEIDNSDGMIELMCSHQMGNKMECFQRSNHIPPGPCCQSETKENFSSQENQSLNKENPSASKISDKRECGINMAITNTIMPGCQSEAVVTKMLQEVSGSLTSHFPQDTTSDTNTDSVVRVHQCPASSPSCAVGVNCQTKLDSQTTDPEKISTTKESRSAQITATDNIHRRAQTVKARYGRTVGEAGENHFMRVSSLKAHLSNTRAESYTSPETGGYQQRRQAILFKTDNLTNSAGSEDGDYTPGEGTGQTPDADNNAKDYYGVPPIGECDVQGDPYMQVRKNESQSTHCDESTKCDVRTNKLTSQSQVDHSLSSHVHAGDSTEGTPDRAGHRGGRLTTYSGTGGEDRPTLSDQGRNRCTSDKGLQSDDVIPSGETCEVSDESDYDNPWDDLDDAVKRASIRYNRRPSRIATGDTKTLLLKSAEDLGRLLEEADKRRQLRQARNSYQVTSPEAENLTIPFTRFSPHRHTVKGILSQPHMSACHSSEDILKSHVPTVPKLSVLRQEGAMNKITKGQHYDPAIRGVDSRRPMSMTSKVRAKISSPESKKRKK